MALPKALKKNKKEATGSGSKKPSPEEEQAKKEEAIQETMTALNQNGYYRYNLLSVLERISENLVTLNNNIASLIESSQEEESDDELGEPPEPEED